MIIKRILTLSDEEFNLLIASSCLLDNINESFKNKEVEELSNGAKTILKNLRKNIDEILDK